MQAKPKNIAISSIWNFIFPVFGICILLTSCNNRNIDEPEFERSVANDAFKEAFHEGMREKMIGHFEKAIPLFEKCLVLSPESAPVHFALSDLYEKTGQRAQSENFAQKAYSLDKTNKWYVLRLADIYYLNGDFAKCASFYEMIIKDEKNIDLKFQYADALIKSNQAKKAIMMLDEIEVETGKSPELSITKNELYLSLRDEESAANELDQLIEDNPGNIENIVVVAEYFLNSRRPLQAEKLIAESLLKNPDAGELFIMAADIKLRKGEIDGAFQDIRKGFGCEDLLLERKLDLMKGLMPFGFNPANPDAKKVQVEMQALFGLIYDINLQNDQLHQIYGSFLQKTGKREEARRQFRLVCDLNPDSYESWSQLLQLESSLKMYQELSVDGKEAFELFPTQPQFYLFAGIGAYESGQFANAEEWLFLGKDLVIKDNVLSSDFLFHLGQTYCRQNKRDEGFSYFDQALVMNPKNTVAYAQKAEYLIAERNYISAESVVVEGMKITPDDPGLLDASGQILLHKKSFADAVKIFERALAPDVFNPKILEHYGDALFLLGDTEKAVEIWKEAKKNGNTSEVLNRKITDGKYYEN